MNTHLAVKNDGHLLELTSGHPGVVKTWASRQTNLPLRIVPILPADVQIQGSRVIVDKSEHIIQVAYSGNQEASSLFAMPPHRISLHGREVTLNGLTFYIQKVNGHS